MKAKITAALLTVFLSMSSWAQMISQTSNANGFANVTGAGQTFTATATTQISRISTRPGASYNGTLLIYNGNNGSGSSGAIGAPAYTQAGVSLVTGGAGSPLQDVVLTTPFPVTAGDTYTFAFEGNGAFYLSDFSPYAGGQLVTGYVADAIFGDYDLVFQIWADTPQTITFTSTVPTAAKVGDSYMVSAAGGGSGNPVVFTIDPSASAVCSVAGATVSLTGVGTCTINANQAGGVALGIDYLPAAQAQQSFSVAALPLPVAAADNYSTSFNTALTVAAPGVLSNDSSPISAPLTAVLVSGAAHGSIVFNASGAFTYTPSVGFSGVDSFTYSASDGSLSSPPVSVSVSVATPLTQSITFTSAAPPSAVVGGSYSVSATGGASGNPVVLSVDPTASSVCTLSGSTVGFTGPGTCIINANQAGGGAFAAATQQQQSFLVTRPLPSATPDTYTTTFNTPLTVAAPGLLSNDSSALSLALTALIDTVPSHGSLTVNSNGSFTYTPNPGYAGVDTFTYKAFDGFASAPVSVSITVAAQPVPASIPTLSQWGLLILSSLIGLLALGRGRVNFLGSRRT